MRPEAKLADISGIETVKLGFFKEVKRKIRELEASNRELEQKRRDIQTILDGIPDVMAVISPDKKVLSVNKSFYDVYPGVEPTGLPCHKIFKGREEPCSPCSIELAMESATRVSRSLQILSRCGENRQIECTASVMRGSEDKPDRILLLQRDVTLEKQFQAKFFLSERMATVGVLAEGVAHEINNPLTSISGFAETLVLRLNELEALVPNDEKAAALFEDCSEFLGTILKECSRCSGIVQNLLTFGHREIRRLTAISLNDIVGNCIKLLGPKLSRLPKDRITLDLGVDDPMVLGHPGELMQVLLNLVGNALYAVGDSGHIRIKTRVRDNLVVLEVADTGAGISPEHIDKLFEPFFTTKPPGQGIGIGLSTCYNIIRKHGGEISVESEPNKGSVFEVILPYLVQ
jgi:signal transduction histidine kinase